MGKRGEKPTAVKSVSFTTGSEARSRMERTGKLAQLARLDGVFRGGVPLAAERRQTDTNGDVQESNGQPERLSSDALRLSPSKFDELTNPMIAEVKLEHPELFTDWNDAEWDELYSLMGMGGPLRRHGVVEAANRINGKREIIEQLHLVLETHLRDAAAAVIESLYRLVQPAESNMLSDGWQPPSRDKPRDSFDGGQGGPLDAKSIRSGFDAGSFR